MVYKYHYDFVFFERRNMTMKRKFIFLQLESREEHNFFRFFTYLNYY